MLWIDNSTSPYTIQAFNGTDWDIVSGVASGTRMLFQQTTAPVGWTKDTSNSNTALRVTNGTVTTGGSLNFTSAFSSSRPTTGTVSGTALTQAQMPIHSHAVSDPGHTHTSDGPYGNRFGGTRSDTINTNDTNFFYKTPRINSAKTGISIANSGSGQAHTHGFTGGSINLAVKYVDVIIAEKD
jgi:microcystin-dependent protein